MEIMLQVLCEGTVTPRSPDYFSGGQWYPGDRADVKDFRVFLERQGGTGPDRIDITDFIPGPVLDSLELVYLEVNG